VTGTQAQFNGVNTNGGSGLMLDNALGATIGGPAVAKGNTVLKNDGYGLLAFGACYRSLVQGNLILNNTRGNVNVSKAKGLTYIP
jgi:hypothetical protein